MPSPLFSRLCGQDAGQELSVRTNAQAQEQMVKDMQLQQNFKHKYSLWNRLPTWAKSIEITPDPFNDNWEELEPFGLTIDAASQ